MSTYISLPTASKMASKSTTTLRRWAKIGVVRAEKNSNGQWSIDREHLMAHLATTKPTKIKETAQSHHHDSSTELVRTLETALERERRLNDDLREQNKKYQGDLIKLTSEMRAILSKNNTSLVSRWLRT